MKLKAPENILISPLEWGLGHAGRMIPLARRLQEMNNRIFIAAGEEHTALFRKETEGMEYIRFAGFRPFYSRHLPQYLVLFLQLPLLLFHSIRDHLRLKRIIREYDIGIVISDNRFGLWNSSVRTAYITHQPRIPFPPYLRFLEPAGVILHRMIIKKYDLCFIPDLPGEENLTGRLTRGIKLPANVRYTGILSRFDDSGARGSQSVDPLLYLLTRGEPYNTIILSGPEPQRGLLKEKLISTAGAGGPLTVILEGKPSESREPERSGSYIFCQHLSSSAMGHILRTSGSVICRPGYTTIMELVSLGCSALLIPTPGQTEQEYLAAYLSSKGWFATVSQKAVSGNMPRRPNRAMWSSGLAEMSRDLLGNALGELLKD
ncbi:MAG: hypothetical protein K0B05_08350 [Bacteroidales bacterium]|nr:hypothetical protein [Bacteroidales bacterium]